ncbi:hypothetical protein F7725_001686 [Dissostichus mawsoni]|uniref:Uncharacterized protein n=1 Tax=Dissostichus mawsoni TaxID=36200 RepID=A0A7J5Y2D6_DISMA|nr:hypothetical protein F7725_001686 [Dissostichus mawsoni]
MAKDFEWLPLFLEWVSSVRTGVLGVSSVRTGVLGVSSAQTGVLGVSSMQTRASSKEGLQASLTPSSCLQTTSNVGNCPAPPGSSPCALQPDFGRNGPAGEGDSPQAKKKWDNLKKKYKDCKYPGSGEGVSGKPTAASWPWFVQMDEVLQRPSIRPPVLISSIPEDTPQPSAAVGDQEVEEEEVADVDSQPGPSQGRKRKGRDELVDLIKRI